MHANFFEAGGDSLAAARFINEVGTSFSEHKLNLSAFYSNPTIASSSEYILSSLMNKSSDNKVKKIALPPITVGEKTDRIPSSFQQKRIWFLEQLNPIPGLYNVMYTQHFIGKINLEILEKALIIVINRHDILRTVLLNDGSVSQKVVSTEDFNFKLNVVRIDENFDTALNQINELVRKEVNAPFYLSTAPLFRATIIKTSE